MFYVPFHRSVTNRRKVAQIELSDDIHHVRYKPGNYRSTYGSMAERQTSSSFIWRLRVRVPLGVVESFFLSGVGSDNATTVHFTTSIQ